MDVLGFKLGESMGKIVGNSDGGIVTDAVGSKVGN